jgi:hypothetical protein
LAALVVIGISSNGANRTHAPLSPFSMISGCLQSVKFRDAPEVSIGLKCAGVISAKVRGRYNPRHSFVALTRDVDGAAYRELPAIAPAVALRLDFDHDKSVRSVDRFHALEGIARDHESPADVLAFDLRAPVARQPVSVRCHQHDAIGIAQVHAYAIQVVTNVLIGRSNQQRLQRI